MSTEGVSTVQTQARILIANSLGQFLSLTIFFFLIIYPLKVFQGEELVRSTECVILWFSVFGNWLLG